MTLGWDAPRGNRAQSGPVAEADTPDALAAAAADAAVAAARRALPARAKQVFRDKVAGAAVTSQMLLSKFQIFSGLA